MSARNNSAPIELDPHALSTLFDVIVILSDSVEKLIKASSLTINDRVTLLMQQEMVNSRLQKIIDGTP